MAKETLTQIQMERLPETDKEHVAAYISEEIRARIGEYLPHARPMNALEMHRASVAMQVRIAELQSVEGEGAVYLPAEESPALAAAILLTRNIKDRRRARLIAHELANHFMRERVALELYNVDEVICTRQDNRAVRHHIAQNVEGILFDDGAHAE